MKALVVDNGLFPDVARRLAQEGYTVEYFSSWGNSFPQSREMHVGEGIEGVERIDQPIIAMLDKPDIVVVSDIYLDDYVAAAKAFGIPVMGGGEGTKLETDRWFLKEMLAEADCEVNESVPITGIEKVREYLETHPDTYVKVSIFRGDMETRSAKAWLTEYYDMRKQVGEIGRYMEFIVEDEIPDALEIGIDGWWCRDQLLTPFIVGAEIKDAGYIGYVCDSIEKLPKEAQKVVKALGRYFAKTDYRGFFSNEMRVLKDGTTYMTDATCRIPSPPGGILMKACSNLGEVVHGLAIGRPVAPDFEDAEYLTELVLKSPWVEEHFLEVDYPVKDRESYTFHQYCVLDGKTWIAPHRSGMQEFGSALGMNSLEGALADAEKAAKAVNAHQLEYAHDALGKAKEAMAQAEKLGYAR